MQFFGEFLKEKLQNNLAGSLALVNRGLTTIRFVSEGGSDAMNMVLRISVG